MLVTTIFGVAIFTLANPVLTGSSQVFKDGFEEPLWVTGRVLLSLTMPIPEESRATLIANAAIIEAEGYSVAEGGSAVTFPDSTPAGWLVRFGPLETFATEDGSFDLNVVGVNADTGFIYHPSHEDEAAVGTFSRSDLVVQGETPVPLVLELPFDGPCTMTVGPDNPAHCQVTTVTDADPSYASLVGFNANQPPIILPHNTYPPTPRESFCQILDGWIDPSIDPLLAYFGSTCSIRVATGACPNEGGFGIFSATICCFKNHKGRFCQSVTHGDMKLLDLPNDNVVTLDSVTTFTVHNNANWGMTLVSAWEDKGIGGKMPQQADYFDGEDGRINHFDADKLAAYSCSGGGHPADIYVADRVVTYKTPRCLTQTPADEAKDQYLVRPRDFGELIVLAFRLEQGNLWQFENGGGIFDLIQALELRGSILSDPEPIEEDRGCVGQHIHGIHPCTGAPDPDPMKCGHGIVMPLGG